MVPRRLDRISIRARLDDIPGWIIETLLDDFEPAALKALAAAEDKKRPQSKADQSGDCDDDRRDGGA